MTTTTPSVRRLLKEAAELTTSPSPHFTASPISDSNLYDWHFTLAGPPPPSPYAAGIYHGRIVLPATYPLRPPSFRFLTPSGRFEVNREICLSISGHHEETWQPAWGIRTALLALRSFMDAEAQGQVGGLEASDEVRREWAAKSRRWRCDVCHGGRMTNEEILSEWRRECRRRGTATTGAATEGLEDDAKADSAAGLARPPGTMDVKLAPRDQDGEEDGRDVGAESRVGDGANDVGMAGGGDGTGDAGARVQEQAAVSSSSSRRSHPEKDEEGTSVPPSCALAAPTASGRPISTLSSPLLSSPALGSTRDYAQPLASQTQTVRPNHRQRDSLVASSTAQQHRVRPSRSCPWLDWAIVGVLVALVFMILRRIAKSDDL